MNSSVYRVGKQDRLEEIVRLCQESPESQVVLIVPRGTRALQNPTNLRLLRAYVRDNGKSLILVTEDKLTCDLASAESIPVYSGLSSIPLGSGDSVVSENEGAAGDDSATSHSSPGKRSRRRRSRPVYTKLAVLVMAVAASFAVYFLVTPRVVVTLSPITETVDFSMNRIVAVGEDGLTPHGERLSDSLTAMASGRSTVGDKESTGTVTLYNLGMKQVTVPKGSLLTTEGARGPSYITQKAVELPVGQVVGGKVVAASKTDVLVAAKEPGISGNLGKAVELVMPTVPKGSSVVAVTATEISGGTDRIVIRVTEADLDAVRQRLADRLHQMGKEHWYRAAESQAGVVIPEQELSCDINVTANRAAGDEAASVIASGEVLVSGYLLQSETLWEIIRDDLTAQVSLPGYEILSDTLRITAVSLRPVGTEPTLELKANAQVDRRSQVDSSGLRNLLAGVPVDRLQETLPDLGAAAHYTVSPNNTSRLPKWPGWLKVVVRETD